MIEDVSAKERSGNVDDLVHDSIALSSADPSSQAAPLMHANPGRVSNYREQTVAGKNYPAVQYRGDYGTFIVLFDPATSLPAIVRTRDFDVLKASATGHAKSR